MTDVADVSPDQLDALIADGCALIDIRGAEDFAEGHVPGAVNIPANQLKADPSQLTSLLDDDSVSSIALICMRGHTSRRIADELVAAPAFAEAPALADLGVLNSLDGGTVAWERSGRALEQ